MFIIGVGTAAPATRYTQGQCYEALQGSPQFEKLDRSGRALLKHVLTRDNGISTRALALDPLTDAFDASPDVLHRRFAEHAPRLAQQAAEEALNEAGVSAHEIDGVIISTCTGYLCPGLSSYVIERVGLRNDVVALDLVGQGCGAALPNLRTAEALLAARRCDKVLSICVEVCSAAFYIDNDPGVLVSACLFGDGAGAAVVSRDAVPGRACPEWKRAGSYTDPKLRDALRFEQRDGMLRNILTPEVPALAATHAALVLDRVLGEAGLTRERIGVWIWHAGGRTVLDALRREFGLEAEQVQASAQVLHDFGNVSSACVYFVLQRALANGVRPGWWWLSSFGAGFSCHGALLEVRAA
ncbi:MAG TPA: type III polyketide synthase [Burkholderiales bacterium]|nr:type III polyketide synthase [Burkholderiales bacterium]